jgi:hypothetical protein
MELMKGRPKAFTVLGIIFLALGVLSFLTVMQGWYLAQSIAPRAGVYGLLDFLVAYAFLARQWWLLPAFALNAVGQIALFSMKAYYAQELNGQVLFSLFGTIVAIGIAAYVYRKRTILVHDKLSYVLSGVFLATWGVGFWYALTLITSL